MSSFRPPSVDRLMAHPDVAALVAEHGRGATLAAVRDVLSEARLAPSEGDADPARIAARAGSALAVLHRPSLRRVFNLTGTVLHTNLGRAPLPEVAAQAVAAVLTGASNLEYDLDRGDRGDRDVHLEGLVCRLTGAEAATVVNNNAAAVLLVLNTLAQRREVLVSRGELVEIGGSFRVPDVMSRAGCRLREVGTTNRTHLADFADAIGPRTALAMRVHQSNFEIRGFTAAVPDKELGRLCRERNVPFAVDLGSGSLIDLAQYGLPPEPTVQQALAHADLVTFSGDKLLGGAQCGIIAGRRGLLARIRRNPLKRALRVDKMTIAAMEAVLRLYLHPERLAERLPTLRLLTRPEAEIAAQAERLREPVAAQLAGRAAVAVEPCRSQIGSGALPGDTLPSACLAITPPRPGRGAGAFLQRAAEAFRALPVPVVGRIAENGFRLDLRALDDEAGFVGQITKLSL